MVWTGRSSYRRALLVLEHEDGSLSWCVGSPQSLTISQTAGDPIMDVEVRMFADAMYRGAPEDVAAAFAEQAQVAGVAAPALPDARKALPSGTE